MFVWTHIRRLFDMGLPDPTEVRAERDVLQARMSEQALKISSLAARLERQRNDAHALAHTAASQLSVQLHDAQAEVQRLKEELESKDKQLSRLKQNSEERELLSEKHAVLYGNSCNPKDKVIILERELSTAQSRIAQLESLASELQEHNDKLRADVEEQRAVLLDKEEQLNQIMALKLEEEQIQKSEIVEGKTSGRTLSDIVSISEYDEQDLQMRRAELKQNNSSLTDAPHKTGEKTPNRTLPPEVQRPYMSSLNIDYVENTDVFSPRAESLPANFTPAQNKDKFKRNVNETTIFGTIDKFGESVKHSTAQNIQDNCSMYPNQNVSVSNNISVEPKKINFSLEPSENKTFDDFTSLQELGITLDLKQENFPDILSQLKHEIKKSRSELENCRTELKNAEEQLCEFPAIKEEVEELKSLLENTMATMEKDKKYYESQLENFSSNKNILEQKLSALQQELNEKSKDLNLLKEDILRRETMILELAKEKRNLTGKISELESRINELQNKNVSFEKYETENKQLRDRISELQKLEQLVTEKNQQIDSLNQHLDRLDDLQRRLNDRTEEVHNLKQALQDKSNELFQMQDSVVALNRDMTKVVEENDHLSSNNQELKLRLTKLEKEQENASLKLQNSENELEKVNSINSELTSRIEELKHLSEEMRLKQAKIDMLNEDMKSYHNEIASLKEQLEIVSRSPSPKSKSGEEMRQAGDDRKQLARIKKQIALLQHELDFNKKDLNDKAFELAKAKQDVLELKDNLSQAVQKALVSDQNDQELRSSNQELQREIQGLQAEKQQLAKQLEIVLSRLREESNVSELKQKLKDKSDRCRELEVELSEMRELVERLKGTGMELSTRERASRSPTAELERALRLQLQHSRSLDEDIIEILSASSDEREDIPRLALNSSNSSGAQSSGCARLERARGECERLRGAADSLRARLLDKDALIAELHRTREQLSEEVGRLRASEQTQRDLAARLQLQLDAALQQHDALQKQDSSMISMLKRRLESAMNLELELREREQQLLQRQNQPSQQTQHNQPSQPSSPVSTSSPRDKLALEAEESGARLLRAQLTLERERGAQMRRDAERALEAAAAAQRDRDAAAAHHASELAALCRLKHEAGVELVRAKELISIQAATIRQLEDKLATTHAMRDAEAGGPRRDDSALSADEKEQAIRYLQGRCLRVESWRKALIWQKRYLQRVIAGYQTAVSLAEKSLATPITQAPPLAPKQRFRCVVNVVRTVLRMGYLVRRRQHVRALAAACILSDGAGAHTPTNQLRDRFSTPLPRTNHAREHARATPTYTQNYTPLPKAPPLTLPRTTKLGNNLARRLLKHDVGLNISADNLEEAGRRSPYTSSPRDHRFILSSPREVPSAHQSELDAPAARPRALYRDTP